MHGQSQLTSSAPPKCGCDLLRRLISFLGAGVRGGLCKATEECLGSLIRAQIFAR